MNIVISGSMSASKEMVEVGDQLVKQGHEVILPSGTEQYATGEKSSETIQESTKNKRDGNLIRGYYNKIHASDAVLIVNPPKRGVDGYIGANTFLEIAFGHVLDKHVFVLYDYSQNKQYLSEIEAMNPKVLHGDLSQIPQ